MNEIGELADLIIDKTKDGRVQDWNERIADIARETDVKMEAINWNGSPQCVAVNVVNTIWRYIRNFDKLREVLDSKK